jgi:fucose 4-O-acetylase-like acetyltransferase
MRNYNIQLMRTIAIFLVILNHASSWCQFYNPSQYVKSAYMSLATTGVPIFIMISGALLLSKYNEPILVFFKKRMNKIIVPFVCWSYIYLIYVNVNIKMLKSSNMKMHKYLIVTVELLSSSFLLN